MVFAAKIAQFRYKQNSEIQEKKMKVKFTTSIILMALCALILVGTIGLYAADTTQSAEEKCGKYCKDHYPEAKELYDACYEGCIFGSEL
jgi:hypothetical protein